MTRDELLKWKQEIESEYRANIAAVNQLLKRFALPEPQVTSAAELPLHGNGNGETAKSLFRSVESAVEKHGGNFSLRDIARIVEKDTGEVVRLPSISSAIFRLKKKGKIKLQTTVKPVQNGKGRAAAIYCKT